MEVTDKDLLDSFVARRTEDAFQQLVTRHLPMVFTVALRVTEDYALSQDIAQSTFLALSENARSLEQKTVIAGWLYHKARHFAMTAARSERRRRNRERLASTMNFTEPEPALVAEYLESAMEELSQDDRDALVLRFLEDRNLREVGAELGVGEDAARMRINRALERLRGIFGKQGITGTASAFAAAIGTSAHAAAIPAGLGTAITSAVLSTGTVATSTAVATQAAATAMKLFNAKIAATIVVVAAVTGTSTYVLKEREAARLREANQSLSASNARLSEELKEKAPAPEAGEGGKPELPQPLPQRDLAAARPQVNQLQSGQSTQTNAQIDPYWEARAPAARAMARDPKTDAASLAGAINVLQLVRDHSPDIVDRLIKNFSPTNDVYVQMETLSYLTNSPDNPEVGKLLTSVLADQKKVFDPMVRERAVDVLIGQLPDPNAKAWLEWITTNDANVNLRSHARSGLNWYSAEETARALRKENTP